MAKFRTNHSKQTRGTSSNMVARVGLFGAIIGGLFFLFNQFMGSGGAEVITDHDNANYADEYFLPTSTTGAVVHHKKYSLSYHEEYEQAEWVAHILTREELNMEWGERNDNFRPDPQIKTGSADLGDYRGSGYDRGHLVPAADMAYNAEAMDETFFLSNISPQSRNFNKGIWRELEELTRNWAKKYKKLYVVTGPVLTEEPKGYIGGNEVAIPTAFFKVLLDISEPELKGIAFVIPNEVSYEPLFKYATSIDKVEELTGIDFFPELISEELAAELEGNFNIDLWEFSKRKYDLRIEKWNK